MIDKNQIHCPVCGKKDTWTTANTFRPFCSERCKLIDLGEWASETRRVAGEAVDPTQTSEDKEE